MLPPDLKCLVLNIDYTPLTCIGWKRAFKKVFSGLTNVVEYYDMTIKDSAGREHLVPAVVRAETSKRHPFKKVNFSKVNVFRRDSYTCQYCGKRLHPTELTLDHVVPRAMWKGPVTPTNWKNIVTCCLKCNRKKNDRTPQQAGMPLKKKVNGKWVEYQNPKQPSKTEMLMNITSSKIPKEWEPYIPNS
jgi:5-methylcytosine-specific restriction endonuclease McrA